MNKEFIDFTKGELDYYNETGFRNRICTVIDNSHVNILKYEDGTYLVMFATANIPHYHCPVFPTEQLIRDYVKKA